MRGRSWLLLLLLVTGVAWPLANRMRDRADRGRVQGQVLSAVRVNGRSAPLAGVSARADVALRAVSERRIGADRTSPEYHRYLNRCATCHAAPAPELYRAGEWPAVIDRMHGNMRAAGTLGLPPADREAVLRFLARHARR